MDSIKDLFVENKQYINVPKKYEYFKLAEEGETEFLTTFRDLKKELYLVKK